MSGIQVTRQLRLLAEQNALVHFQRLDENGLVIQQGRCRIQDFDEAGSEVWVDLPTSEGQAVPALKGEKISLVFESRGMLLKCDSKVIDRRIYTDPGGANFPALVLEAPASLESGNRRRHFRVEPLQKSMPTAQIRLAANSKNEKNTHPWLKVGVRDISVSGIGVITPVALAEKVRIGVRFELSLTLPGAAAPIVVNAEVRRVGDHHEGGVLSKERKILGLEFEVEPQHRDAGLRVLAPYVIECQREIARALKQNQ